MVLLSTEREEQEPSSHIAPDAIRPPPHAPVGDEPPGKIGRYVIIQRIGQGGMGVVYSAYDPELDRRIALKLLSTAPRHPSSAARLQREARSMARLAHPNVVAVYDAGTAGTAVYIAMEFVRGHNLRQWLQADPRRPWRERLQKFIEAGRGLGSAHALEIVHRDFKPDNVLVREDGRVQVADFGLAKQAQFVRDEAPPPPDAAIDAAANTVRAAGIEPSRGLTAAGQFVGTPAYMSPEQITGRDVGPRSDQFSFCVALYEALYGARPFDGASTAALFDAILAGRVRQPPRGSPIPRRIFDILRRGMATDPALRYPTMEDLLRDLLRDPGRRAAIVSGAVVAAASLVALSWTLWDSRRAAVLEAERAERAEATARDNEQKAAAADRRARDEAERGLYRARSTLASVLVERRPSVAGALLWTVPPAQRDEHWRQAALDVVHANHPLWTITTHPELPDSIHMLARSNAFLSLSDGVIYRHDLAARTSFPIHETRNMVSSNSAVSADERWLAAAWPNGEVRIWSLQDPTAPPRSVYGHADVIHYLAFSGDGKALIGGFADGKAYIWDLAAGTRIPLDAGDDTPVLFVAATAEGSWLTATLGAHVTVWSATGARLVRKRLHRKAIWDAALSRDRRRLATSSEDRTVCVWDATSLAEFACFHGHTGGVNSVEFGETGDWVVSAAVDGTAWVWDLTGRERHQALAGHLGTVNGAVFMNGDEEVLTAGDDKTVRRWRRDGSGAPIVYRGHEEGVAGVFASPRNDAFVTASEDHTVVVWTEKIAGPTVVKGISPLGKFAEIDLKTNRLVGNFDAMAIGVWDASDGTLLGTLRGHEELVWNGRFSPDGRILATASSDRTVRTWDVAAMKPLAVLPGHTLPVLAVGFSPDGRLLASGSWDTTARLWRPDTGELVAELTGHTDVVSSLDFSADGRWLVTGASDNTPRLWDLSGPRLARAFEGHTGAVASARFSPDGRQVVSAAYDNTARIWSVNGGPEHELRGHLGTVVWAEFDPSGQRVVTAADDGTVRIWDSNTGEEQKVLRHHSARVRRATFTPDGHALVSASYDRTARIEDLEAGSSIAFRGHAMPLWWARFLPEQRLLTFSMDGAAAIWDARIDLESLTDRLARAMNECPSVTALALASGESEDVAAGYRALCEAAIARSRP